MVGSMVISDKNRKTLVWFRFFKDFEIYIDSFDEGYNPGDSIFTGYIYKLETPVISIVIRSRFGKRTDFKQDINKVIGGNCYIPTSQYCFMKWIDFLTGRNWKQQSLEITRNQQRRSHVITQTRIKPFCSAETFNIV